MINLEVIVKLAITSKFTANKVEKFLIYEDTNRNAVKIFVILAGIGK